jgi:ATP-dependent Clp protease adaptor protein ClpS
MPGDARGHWRAGGARENGQMAEKEKPQDANDIPSEGNTSSGGGGGGGGAAVAKPKSARKASPKKKPPQPLPPWKVLLHNDDKNELKFVVETIVELTPLNAQDAELRTKEANDTGVSLLLVTHKERAELYKDQFESKGLTVTIEPAEK